MAHHRIALVASIVPVVLAASCACNEAPPPSVAKVVPPPSATVAPVVDAAPPAPAMPSYGYPATRRDNFSEVIHGVEVADPYRWLEDAKTPEVQAWMKAEDDFTRARLSPLAGRDKLVQRFKELFYIEAMGIPHRYGARYFYQRRDAKSEKWVVYARQGKIGAEAAVLDPNTWSKDGSVSLGGWRPSWDGKKVVYKVKANNSDEATIKVLDVASGKTSDVDVIPGGKYAGPDWTPNSDGFYYTWLPTDPSIPTDQRPGFAEMRFHKLGTDPAKDPVLHERIGDAKTFLNTELSRDGRWLFVVIEHGWTGSDIYFQDTRDKDPRKWKLLAEAKDGIFEVRAYRDRFYVKTNSGAPRWRIFRVDPAHVERDKWTEIVPERKDATLQSYSIVGGRLSIAYMKDVVSKVEVHELDGKLVREIDLPGLGSASALSGDEDDDEAFYSYDSFTQPAIIFETSVKTGAKKTYYELKVPVDTTKYVVDQEKFPSKDGTIIPMFVIHAKDAKKDGTAPTILYGYGGFQIAQTPSFRTSIYPWLENGGVYAIASLRGGSEYGEEWHQQGMRRQKQHVFDDVIAAAENLIKLGYTKPDKLAIRGGSNGGLLVGAAITQRPDLFRVGLCAVPLLDMVRYHRFGSGRTWIEEYGSADDPDDFKAIYAYSPYHRVQAGTKYPSVLLLSADSDDRVDPLHARKFAASLQAASTGGVVLLRIEQHAGHGGADLVRAWVESLSDEYAFALSEMSK
jgi:prolyl oligopeptidase